MAQSNIENAIHCIDNYLEEGYSSCFFSTPLSADERKKVVDTVLENGWVSNLDSYECRNYEGTDGVLFVWDETPKEVLEKYYQMK